MDLLNGNSLASLLRNCYQNGGYRSCILFNNREDAHTLLNELIEAHNQNGIDGVRSFRQISPAQIVFENGSTLTFLTTSDEVQLRGARFHEALLHEAIMDIEAMLALQSHICEYRNFGGAVAQNEATRDFHKEYQCVWGASENPDVEIKVDEKSKEVVDDFLDSFKIHNSLEFGS